MNQLAKVFIIINFVLSIIYLAVSGMFLAQKWDYRQMYLEKAYQEEQTKADCAKQVSDVQKRIESFKEAATQARHFAKETLDQKNRLEKENSDLKTENLSYATEVKQITGKIDNIHTTLNNQYKRISELEAENKNIKDLAESAEKSKDEAEEARQRYEAQLNNLQGELRERELLLQNSEKELREAKLIIRAVRDSGVNIATIGTGAKALDGQIMAVSDQAPIVIISLGSDHGVEKGNQFTVYRGSKFIGRVVIEEVYKEMSAARILREMTVDKIRNGDSITTRIGGGSF